MKPEQTWRENKHDLNQEVNLIVAALKDEVKTLLSEMVVDCTVHLKPATLYKGKIFDRAISLLVTGMGGERMKRGLEGALALEFPKTILLVGFCGGAAPVVKPGSLVLAEEVVDIQNKNYFKPDSELLERGKKLCEESRFDFQIGRMAMVDHVVSSSGEKAEIGITHSAIALDMESAAFAKIADEKKIRWLVAKSVLDPVDEMLPPLEDCLSPEGEPRPLKLAEHLLKNPKEMMQLPKVQAWASQARDSIAKFLEGWIEQ